MYAKTFLNSDAIAELAQSENPKVYLNQFRESSVLLLNTESYKQLSQSLSTTTWGRLKEDIIKGRQLMRAIEIRQHGTSTPTPDVIVVTQTHDGNQPPIRCKLREFDEVPLIERLMRLRRGESDIRDREEFWQICLRPVLDGVRSQTPTIEYFDSYVFHDSMRPMKKKMRNGSSKNRDHSGIAWLLQKIERFANHADVNPVLYIYSETDKGEMTKEAVVQEFTEIVDWLHPKKCDIKLRLFESRIVDLAVNRDLKQSLHSRTLFINRQNSFSFNYGTRNLGLEFNSQTDEYEDQIRRNWRWTPAISDEWKDFLLFRMPQLVADSHHYELIEA